jgi:hypothetical protein
MCLLSFDGREGGCSFLPLKVCRWKWLVSYSNGIPHYV